MLIQHCEHSHDLKSAALLVAFQMHAFSSQLPQSVDDKDDVANVTITFPFQILLVSFYRLLAIF